VGKTGRLRVHKHVDRDNTLLFAAVGPEDEVYLGLLIFAAFWALLSGAVVLLSIHEASQRSAWRWTASLAVASLAAAYSLWRLL
jgi:uncharacterized membrane protein